MNLLVLDVQSINDVVTNSSSEIFVLNTDKTCEEVNTILSGITSGFRFPVLFNLEDYRKWRTLKKDEEDYHYPLSLYEFIEGYFIDPENENDVIINYRDFLFNPWKYMYVGSMKFESYGWDSQHQINIDFWKFLKKHTDEIKKLVPEYEEYSTYDDFREDRYNLSYYLPDSIIKEFKDSYKGEIPKEMEIPKRFDVTRLDGKVLVLSEDDNSIPYDTWDSIYNMFDCYNVHLG